MLGMIENVPSLKSLKGASNDDWLDRLNHVWTVFLFGLFAIVVSTGQFVGEPIHCWCPAEFTGAYVDYANAYCWIKNTYFIPMENPIPIDDFERRSKELSYYQWVPLILLFQAFLFKLPNIAWRMLNGGAGLNMEKIVELAEQTQFGSADDRAETIDHIGVYMHRWLMSHKEHHHNRITMVKHNLARFCCLFCNKRAGTYLTGLYLFTKILYLANTIGQFFLVNMFLGNDYLTYGWEVLNTILNHGSWRESARFPRVTLCDFKIRQLQNIQTWTVQCVLPINLFNEKIFLVIWFWVVFMAGLTALNLGHWLFWVMFKRNRFKFVKKYLLIRQMNGRYVDPNKFRSFADDYLRDDGVFVLRVISKNSTELVLIDLMEKLMDNYKEQFFGPDGEPVENNIEPHNNYLSVKPPLD